MEWHFDADTGSRFWLDRAAQLPFDPRTDVRTFDDLRLFPNFTNELRDVKIADLIPRGYGPTPEIARVVESGGTTGAPKPVVLLKDWWELLIAESARHLEAHEVPRNCNVLALVPSGPHGAGEQWRSAFARLGCVSLNIDLDPRWVKKLVGAGRDDEVARYVEHVIDQAEHHLLNQDIGIVGGTPPLIAALCRRDALVDRMQETVGAFCWGGAHMDADTRHLYRTELFPNAKLVGGYGTTMALGGGATERPGLADNDPCILDPFSPYVTFSVVDAKTLDPVPIGQRGQLLVNHVSKSFFLPCNLERDEALRVTSLPDRVGDAIADVTPVAEFDGAPAIEGVY
jgi:acyl-CoA synthetase (AMP-forming)/AMP-acid ligase II